MKGVYVVPPSEYFVIRKNTKMDDKTAPSVEKCFPDVALAEKL